MSSALAMVLMAAMVPGNGPEMVSGEVEQGLDLSGEWEGGIMEKNGAVLYRVRIDPKEIAIMSDDTTHALPTSNLIDEGVANFFSEGYPVCTDKRMTHFLSASVTPTVGPSPSG